MKLNFKRALFIPAALLGIMVSLQSCKEEIDTSARYVFTDVTIQSYLEAHLDKYGEYVNLLKSTRVSSMSETTVMQLLSARGNYTCFAPTNEAIQLYLEQLKEKGVISEASWDGFDDKTKLDSVCKVIVHNSIINSGDEDLPYQTFDMPTTQDAEIPRANMYDRKLVVHYPNSDTILINDCPLDPINRNIKALNGYIHCMHKVVAPSNNTLGAFASTNIRDKRRGFYVASLLLNAIGYLDTLSLSRDEVYEVKYQSGLIPEQVGIKSGNLDNIYMGYTPEHRYYGYTYFAETDEFWEKELNMDALDITVQDVYDHLVDLGIYPDAKHDDNYASEDNILNRFVTYHLLPERLATDCLVNHWSINGYFPVSNKLGAAIWENYTTMGHRRILKIYESEESHGIYLNRFPVINDERNGDHHELSCETELEGIKVGEPNLEGENNMRNAIIYPINKLLVYDETTRNEMSKRRLRFDACVMWPETMNNDIRSNKLTDIQHRNIGIPNDGYYQYCKDMWLSKDTYFAYWSCRNDGNKNTWTNYLGDECNLTGSVEVTMRLPPVPRSGIYELRYACQNGGAQGNRGIFQFYWGDDFDNLAAVDVPINFMIGGTKTSTPTSVFDSGIDWIKDGDDDELNDQNDQQMRMKGFMKGAKIYYANPYGHTGSGRDSEITNRRILLRKQMDAEKTYYLRFRACLDDPMREMYLDYIELCPKEVYDNPEKREDIW